MYSLFDHRFTTDRCFNKKSLCRSTHYRVIDKGFSIFIPNDYACTDGFLMNLDAFSRTSSSVGALT